MPRSGGPAPADDARRHGHVRADGTPKTRFASADDANRASLHVRLEYGRDVDPYPCESCGGWHLGSRRD